MEKLSTAWRREIGKKKPLAFVEEKLAERDLRHKRFDDTRYVVEPNVKDGKGGLRDLHSLFWIAKYAYRADGIMDLLARVCCVMPKPGVLHRHSVFMDGALSFAFSRWPGRRAA
ncbi:MAG: hypothetical protein CM15mP46_0660 [Alphaproteobacteria bacterium]|nr:MAG: hypothetical protein CM15mP46_0660 [Alphaproteobacteria bacterium]